MNAYRPISSAAVVFRTLGTTLVSRIRSVRSGASDQRTLTLRH